MSTDDSYPRESDVETSVALIYQRVLKMMNANQYEFDAGVRERLAAPQTKADVMGRLSELFYARWDWATLTAELEHHGPARINKNVLKAARSIQRAMEDIPAEFIDVFSLETGAKPDLFTEKSRKSLTSLIHYCETRPLMRKARGRPKSSDLKLLTSEAVDVFEFWIGRSFRKSIDLARHGEGKSFASPDASCIDEIVRGVDPGVTSEMVRSALKQVPARGRKSKKSA